MVESKDCGKWGYGRATHVTSSYTRREIPLRMVTAADRVAVACIVIERLKIVGGRRGGENETREVSYRTTTSDDWDPRKKLKPHISKMGIR